MRTFKFFECFHLKHLYIATDLPQQLPLHWIYMQVVPFQPVGAAAKQCACPIHMGDVQLTLTWTESALLEDFVQQSQVPF